MFQDMTLIDLTEIAEDLLSGEIDMEPDELQEFQVLVFERLEIVQKLEAIAAST